MLLLLSLSLPLLISLLQLQLMTQLQLPQTNPLGVKKMKPEDHASYDLQTQILRAGFWQLYHRRSRPELALGLGNLKNASLRPFSALHLLECR